MNAAEHLRADLAECIADRQRIMAERDELALELAQEREQNGTTPPDEPETRLTRLADILSDTWHLSCEADALDHDAENEPARYLVIEYDASRQEHWASTTDDPPHVIAKHAGVDEAGYEECDVHDLDTGQHWSIENVGYRAVPTTPTTTMPEV